MADNQCMFGQLVICRFMTSLNIKSFIGMILLVALAWLFSSQKRIFNWRVVIWGILLQFLFAGFLFCMPAGIKFFLFVNNVVVKLLSCASKGTHFVFGALAVSPGEVSPNGEQSLGFLLAFQALPTIVFFTALMSILYYWRIMPFVIRCFAFVFTRLMKVSGAESLCAASNIFMGIESAAAIRPYLEKMTSSELFVVLTAGMATIASNVLAFYTLCLKQQFAGIAGHLISASLLSAPSALLMAKIMVPETETPVTMGEIVEEVKGEDNSLFEAVINGAMAGMKLIFGIIALLLAVLGLAELLNAIVGFIGTRVNILFGWGFKWSLDGLFTIIFYIPAMLLGLPAEDIGLVAQLLGMRILGTEVRSYMELSSMLSQNAFTSLRSAVIASYALCGFAHVASVAIFVGGISALVPSRMRDLARLGFRALVAATLACLMTACVVGVFITDNSPLLGIAMQSE